MATLIISAVCALALGTGSIASTSDTVNVYIIDNQKVENFDGSQLAGKRVASYVIARSESEAKKVHVITTEDAGKSKVLVFSDTLSISGKEADDILKYVEQTSTMVSGLDANVIIDGKISGPEALMELSPNNIKSIRVHKAGSGVSLEFGDNGKNSVIMVTTGNAGTGTSTVTIGDAEVKAEVKGSSVEIHNGEDMVYILDGKQITADEFKDIPSKKIKSVEVRKDAGTAARYNGAKAVMFITTK